MADTRAARDISAARPLHEQKLLEEWWSMARPIVVDTLVFGVILLALFFGSFGLHLLEKSGYDREHIKTFELLHYYGYLGLFFIFCLNLIIKAALGLFFRERRKR